MECGRIIAGAKISVFQAPVADGFGHSGYQLTDAGLALVGADLAVKIFRRNYVGRSHRPVIRNLDVFLLEDQASLGVGDLGGAKLPLDFVVGGHTWLGKQAAEGQAWGLRLLLGKGVSGSFSFDLVTHFGHFSLLN